MTRQSPLILAMLARNSHSSMAFGPLLVHFSRWSTPPPPSWGGDGPNKSALSKRATWHAPEIEWVGVSYHGFHILFQLEEMLKKKLRKVHQEKRQCKQDRALHKQLLHMFSFSFRCPIGLACLLGLVYELFPFLLWLEVTKLLLTSAIDMDCMSLSVLVHRKCPPLGKYI